MSYRVTWSEKASKHLRKLGKPVRERVAGTVNDLASNPGHRARNPLSACLASSGSGRATGASCTRLTMIAGRSDRRRETPQQGARRPLTLMLVSVALCPRGHDDGTMAIGPWAWFSTACRTEPGPRRPGWLAYLPMTTRSARADNPASARPG